MEKRKLNSATLIGLMTLGAIIGSNREFLEEKLGDLVTNIRANAYGNTEENRGFYLTPYGAVPQSWFYQEDNL